jgi:hypothetical protein
MAEDHAQTWLACGIEQRVDARIERYGHLNAGIRPGVLSTPTGGLGSLATNGTQT